MGWKKREVDASAERDLVTGLIVSDQFSRIIIPALRIDLIESNPVRMVSKWCVDYYKKYEKTPGAVVQELYDANKESLDETTAEAINVLLEDLSDKYTEEKEKFNVDYLTDKVEKYLRERSLQQLNSDVSNKLRKGKIDEAEAEVAMYKKVQRYNGDCVDVMEDKQAIVDAIYEERDILFSMPGALGKLLGPFSRGDLIAVAAPAKRGKTWWLIEIALRAMLSGLKVAFFSLEMTKHQMMRRIFQSFTGEIKKAPEQGDYVSVDIPYFTDENRISTRPEKKYGLTARRAMRKLPALKKMMNSGSLQLFSFPANSIGLAGIEASLANLEYYTDFIPDVVVIDYADYMNADIRSEHRHQIDHIWKGLRSIASGKHCLVVTATHTNKSTYNSDTDQDDLSEDARKLNHVACMFALNQSRDEKRQGIMRVSVLGARHDEFNVNDQVFVLSNLSIGKPYLDSRFGNDVQI